MWDNCNIQTYLIKMKRNTITNGDNRYDNMYTLSHTIHDKTATTWTERDRENVESASQPTKEFECQQKKNK